MARRPATQEVFADTPRADMVHNPPHYTQGGVECIDAIEAALGREGFIAFLRGQVIKYQWRLGHKGPALEDAEKSNWYGTRLAATLVGEGDV